MNSSARTSRDLFPKREKLYYFSILEGDGKHSKFFVFFIYIFFLFLFFLEQRPGSTMARTISRHAGPHEYRKINQRVQIGVTDTEPRFTIQIRIGGPLKS